MGCDGGSNFNNLTFHDGKWWAAGGWDFTVEAADLGVVIEEIRRQKKSPRRDYTFRYNWKRKTWVAWPVNPPQAW